MSNETTSVCMRKRGFPAVFPDATAADIEESLKHNKALALYLVGESDNVLRRILNVIVFKRYPDEPKDVVTVLAYGLYEKERIRKPCVFSAIVNTTTKKAYFMPH